MEAKTESNSLKYNEVREYFKQNKYEKVNWRVKGLKNGSQRFALLKNTKYKWKRIVTWGSLRVVQRMVTNIVFLNPFHQAEFKSSNDWRTTVLLFWLEQPYYKEKDVVPENV